MMDMVSSIDPMESPRHDRPLTADLRRVGNALHRGAVDKRLASQPVREPRVDDLLQREAGEQAEEEEGQHREQVGLFKEGAGGKELFDGDKGNAQHVACGC